MNGLENGETRYGVDTKYLVEHKWWNKCLETSSSLNRSQIIFIVTQTCISSVLCFALNFALCTLAMYGKPAPPFWELPPCIVTSYLLTLILEITVSWFTSATLMSMDVLVGKVAPLSSKSLYWWPEKDSSIYWWLITSDLIIPPHIEPKASWFQRILWHQRRSLPWMLFIAVFLTPIFCGLTYLLWGSEGYNSFPLPQYLVAVYGVAIALITVSFWAIITLAMIGDKIENEKEF